MSVFDIVIQLYTNEQFPVDKKCHGVHNINDTSGKR